jgi:hypothetical protein
MLSFMKSIAIFIVAGNGVAAADVEVAKYPELSASLFETDTKSFIASDAEDIDFINGNDGDETHVNLRGGTTCKSKGSTCKPPFSSCCAGLNCHDKECNDCLANGMVW